jgi:hypothetical protein
MSDDEIYQLTELLKKLEPGFQPYPVFEQIARIITLPVYELVPLRESKDGELEILLLNRGPDDPYWPNMLHTPGTVMRASDVQGGGENQTSHQRIVNDELQGTQLGSSHFVCNVLHESKRGTEQAQVFWAEVIGEPKVGNFYPVSDLPEILIDSQKHFIQAVIDDYDEQTGQELD